MPRDMDSLFKLYECKCGKKFVPTPNWMYKIRHKNGSVNYYCSYTCYRNAGGDNGKFRNIHGTYR